MKIRILSFAVLSLVLFTGISSGQTFNSDKLDSLLSLLAEKNKAMGSLAISENGNIIYARAIGYRLLNPQQKLPSDTKTKYRIGSISKMFTATLVFQLIEEDKLSLSTTLDQFFPSIPNAKSVTIGNMLNHRSGIHSFTNDSDYLKWMTEPRTHDEMIHIISGSKPEFEPDSKAEYSNSNFVLLGYIVEKACNKPYPELLAERICSKIGLNDTYYGGKADAGKNESYSFSYVQGWEQQPETDMSIPHGAGSVISTPSDLVKFIEALFAGRLISQASLDKMKTITDGYGMGIFQFPFEDKKVYGHSGGIDGFSALLCYLPDENLSVAYCSNGAEYSINDIMIGALSIYFKLPYSLPVFTTYSVNQEDLDQYLGVYSSAQIPLKVTFTRNNGQLFAQATGQPSFPLEPTKKDVFKFEKAGVVITFSPEKHEFLLEQGGGKFTFTRDE
jgi:D-alanyl-D-alanine carboxypeptidase